MAVATHRHARPRQGALLRPDACVRSPARRPRRSVRARHRRAGGLHCLLMRHGGPPPRTLDRRNRRRSARLLGQLVAAMRPRSAVEPDNLARGGLDGALHGTCPRGSGFFTVLTRCRNSSVAGPLLVRAPPCFPLGLLTMVLPISPAGLGRGHVAFKRLFEAIGLPAGRRCSTSTCSGQQWCLAFSAQSPGTWRCARRGATDDGRD